MMWSGITKPTPGQVALYETRSNARRHGRLQGGEVFVVRVNAAGMHRARFHFALGEGCWFVDAVPADYIGFT